MLKPVEMRHYLHANPELMFQEFKTTKILIDNISGIEGIKIHRPLETGLVAEYRVNEGPFILFRGDIDALPIKEETSYPWKSGNDYMHACGHDVHTSALYGLLQKVADTRPDHNILFLFQPAEEGGGGAVKTIESGIFDGFDVSKAVALHVTDDYKRGEIATSPGVLFASACEINILFKGKSAHVAFPERGINSFDALRVFLDRIQTYLKNQTERLIFGYGRVESGVARNIIPQLTKAECTLRALSYERNMQFLKKVEEILKVTESETGAETEIIRGPAFSEVFVDPDLYKDYTGALSSEFSITDCGIKMTGEDFGFISKKYPSFMFWLGISNGERHWLHTPYFFPDDWSVANGTNAFYTILKEEIN